jgi:hypothetical protein
VCCGWRTPHTAHSSEYIGTLLGARPILHISKVILIKLGEILIFLYIIKTKSKKNICEIINCITSTALTYLCKLTDTDYRLPKDDTIESKHVAAV